MNGDEERQGDKSQQALGAINDRRSPKAETPTERAAPDRHNHGQAAHDCMKTLLAILSALALVGCAHNADKAVHVKSTVLGLDVSPANNLPGLRLGLVRNHYLTVPVGNGEAASVAMDVDADVSVTGGKAVESLRFGDFRPRLAPTNAPATNTTQSASLTNTIRVTR